MYLRLFFLLYNEKPPACNPCGAVRCKKCPGGGRYRQILPVLPRFRFHCHLHPRALPQAGRADQGPVSVPDFPLPFPLHFSTTKPQNVQNPPCRQRKDCARRGGFCCNAKKNVLQWVCRRKAVKRCCVENAGGCSYRQEFVPRRPME